MEHWQSSHLRLQSTVGHVCHHEDLGMRQEACTEFWATEGDLSLTHKQNRIKQTLYKKEGRDEEEEGM